MATSEVHVVRPGSSPAAPAIVFVHGFSGDARATWGDFPALLAGHGELAGWGIVAIGYATSILPSIRGIWSGDPPLATAAEQFVTQCTHAPALAERAALVLIAHSMGGLVVQRALLDDARVADEARSRRRSAGGPGRLFGRTSAVALFGTPSAGLRKAWFVRWWKAQLKDMAHGGAFVTRLRADWSERFGDEPPFPFVAVAGERDEFVPRESSIEPFPSVVRRVVPGDHVQMVKPIAGDGIAVRIVADLCDARRRKAARRAVEKANASVDALRSRALRSEGPKLSDETLKRLVKSLSILGRDDEAIELARSRPPDGSDAKGVVAGLHKRRWLGTGLEADARAALRLYQHCFEDARQRGDAPQAWYHGINVAFLELLFQEDAAKAGATAKEVERWVERAAPGDLAPSDRMWRLATLGEAQLHRREVDEAMKSYRAALELDPEPWQADSMALHAAKVAEMRCGKAAFERLLRAFEDRDEVS